MQPTFVNPYTDYGFKKLFGEKAKIANFDPNERFKYEESLKIYRDLNNVIETAVEDSMTLQAMQTAKTMLSAGESLEKIQLYTSLTAEQIATIEL